VKGIELLQKRQKEILLKEAGYWVERTGLVGTVRGLAQLTIMTSNYFAVNGIKLAKRSPKIKDTKVKGAGGADEFSDLYRKVQNTGDLKDLEELMQLKNVKKVAQETGIGFDDIKIRIDRNPELVGSGYCGYTSPNGKTITLYPDAFTNTESLVKTLGHERIHIYQINTFGVPQDVEMGRLFESVAWGSEKDWWNCFKMNGGLK